MKYSVLLGPVTFLVCFVHYCTSTIPIHDAGKKFEEIKFDVLPGQILSVNTSGVSQNTIKVRDKKDCVVSCTDVPWCRSVNVKIIPESDGLHECERISVDKYANKEDLKQDGNFIHYSIKNPCEEGPCPNFTVCTVQGNTQNYTCLCKRGFTGEKCKIEIDYCKSNPCQNNATCISDLDMNLYHCNCTKNGTSGYLGKNCQTKYRYEIKIYNMQDGRAVCQGLGVDLPSIHSAEQNEILREITGISNYYLWLGLHAPNQDGNFVWIDGTPVNYTNWSAQQPYDSESCAYIGVDGFWVKYFCIYANGVACLLN